MRFSSLLLAVGVVHLAVVGLVYGDALSTVIDAGVVDAVPDAASNPDAAFWYLFAGLLLVVFGVVVLRIERTDALPLRLGTMLFAVGGFGQVLKPTSPFWTYALIGVVAIVRSRRREPLRPMVGWLMLALAAVHIVAVVAFYGDGLHAIIDGGVVNAVDTSAGVPDAAFWYAFSGLTVVTLALTVRTCETRHRRALEPIAWSVVALSLTGLAVMPASGFWLPLAAGLAGVKIGRRARAEAQQPAASAAPVHVVAVGR